MINCEHRRIAFNATLNAIKTISGIVFSLITFPYVTRVLGIEKVGIYDFSASVISYFSLMASLGISIYGIREGSRYRNDKIRINKFVSEVFSINFISTIISYILLGLCLIIIPRLQTYSAALLILSVEIIFTTLGSAWVCNIYEDFLFITVRTLVISLISLVLTLMIVRKPDDLYLYIAIITLSSSCSNLWNFFYIKKKYCDFRFTLKIDWFHHFRPIMIIFSTTLVITVYVSSDITMLGFMTSDYEVGIYGISVKIYKIIKSIFAALMMVLIPQFSQAFAKEGQHRLQYFFSEVFNILTVLMLPMIVGLYLTSDDIIMLITGNMNIEASQSLRILSIAILFSLYAYIYTQCILIPVRKEWFVFKATVVSAVVNVLLNFVLIPIWGINACAVTTVIAELIVFIIAFFEGRKILSLFDVQRNLITSIIGCFGIVVVCWGARNIDHYIIRFGVSVVASTIVYLLILNLLKNNFMKNIARILWQRKTNK